MKRGIMLSSPLQKPTIFWSNELDTLLLVTLNLIVFLDGTDFEMLFV